MKEANYGPVYAAALYPELAEIARKHGYALSVHGSLARDFDLVAIPWTINADAPDDVVRSITGRFAVDLAHEGFNVREHGRMVTTLVVGFGECFIDLSFMPRASTDTNSAADEGGANGN